MVKNIDFGYFNFARLSWPTEALFERFRNFQYTDNTNSRFTFDDNGDDDDRCVQGAKFWLKLDNTTNNRKRKSWGIYFKKQHWFHTAYNSLSGTVRQRILCGIHTYHQNTELRMGCKRPQDSAEPRILMLSYSPEPFPSYFSVFVIWHILKYKLHPDAGWLLLFQPPSWAGRKWRIWEEIWKENIQNEVSLGGSPIIKVTLSWCLKSGWDSF